MGRFLPLDERGQALIEYALLFLLVTMAITGSVVLFGAVLNNTYIKITAAV